jgi:hypothetical protein
MQVAVFLLRLRGYFWLIPVVALALWGISELVQKFLDYRQRKELIARGIDPETFNKSGPTLR